VGAILRIKENLKKVYVSVECEEKIISLEWGKGKEKILFNKD